MTRRLFIFRHGETDWNRLRRLQGTNDIPLNETGHAQAVSLRPFFERNPVQAWFTSPLERARRTLEVACAPPPGTPVVLPELAEVRLGVLEGLHESEMDARFPPEDIQRWRGFADPDFAFTGAESFRQSNARFDQALERILGFDFDQAAVCTHGFLFRRYLISLSPRSSDFRVPNARVFVLKWTESTGLWTEEDPRQFTDR